MTLFIDAGWILGIQSSNVPSDPVLRDWGALHSAVERHRFERFAGEVYYEEVPTRAAVLLETMVRLRPFEDYNRLIGAVCAWEYMGQSGEPIDPPPQALAKLTKDSEAGRSDLSRTARCLRDWKT
ncbi:hypothetical protein [Streptomyces sp. NPDC048172]|uniref:hypothetical protein n=1 Tax=Streptomyces sp. NPDC048172 TaxID=3365505 RepID=UPI00371805D4